MKVSVFITIDTEHSIGGALQDSNLKPVGNETRIFGKIKNKEYGIPLIMDIAERQSIPLTFFVEVFSRSYFGEEETARVCEYILNRGHDIQLHLHPLFLNFDSPNPADQVYKPTITSYDLHTQTEMIREGKELLFRYGVKNFIAFRAGGFAANLDTLKALRGNGFLIDSSLNRCYLGSPCMLIGYDINDVKRIHGIWEFPITNFLAYSPAGRRSLKPLDINGVSFYEIRRVLEDSITHGPSNIMIIMHSFSFIQPLDNQYTRAYPRWGVIRRFERLCRFLAERSDRYQVKSLGSLDKSSLQKMDALSNHNLSPMPFVYTVLRLFEQGMQRALLWKNCIKK
jgi:hypothetical protein